jgi:putative YphP/YqiW family bacilliredoxin
LQSKILNLKDMYPAEIVIPMKVELTENGFDDLVTADQVDEAIKQEGTTLVVVNSVCGCAAGSARPGILLSLENADKKPDHLATVFAGFDLDAVNKVREHLLPYPPSSPAVALFKDGQLVHFLERHNIEGASASMLANNLAAAFEAYC